MKSYVVSYKRQDYVVAFNNVTISITTFDGDELGMSVELLCRILSRFKSEIKNRCVFTASFDIIKSADETKMEFMPLPLLGNEALFQTSKVGETFLTLTKEGEYWYISNKCIDTRVCYLLAAIKSFFSKEFETIYSNKDFGLMVDDLIPYYRLKTEVSSGQLQKALEKL